MVGWSGHQTVLAAGICLAIAACTQLKDEAALPGKSAGGDAGAGSLGGVPADGESGQTGWAGSAAGDTTDLTGMGGMAGASSDEPDPDAPCPDLKPTTGVTFYACACGPGADSDCEAGIEDAAGTDPAKPLRSLESLRQRFSLLQEGDAVAFCRGGSFKVENDESWLNEGCGAGRCSIRDYTPPWASGDELSPRIDAAGHDGLSLKASQFQVLNLALSGGKRGLRIADGDNALLCGLTLAAFDVGVLLEDSGRNRIEQSTFTSIAGPAISQISDSSEFDAIVHNHFVSVALNLTSQERLARTGAIDVRGASKNMVIQGNDFQRVAPDEEFGCSAYAIAVHGEHNHLVVSENQVDGGEGKVAEGCGGLLIDSVSVDSPTTTSSAAFVRRNRLRNLGFSFIEALNCVDCVFDSNLLVQEKNAGATNGFWFTGAISGLALVNNTVYFSATGDAEVSAGVYIRPQDGEIYTTWIWYNNLFVFRGIADSFTCFLAQGEWEISLASSNNNACYAPLVGAKQWMPTYTLSAWQEATDHDSDSVGVDPGLIEVAGEDFLRPRAPDSLLIGRGSAIYGSDEDLDGVQRHSPPDIGAREH